MFIKFIAGLIMFAVLLAGVGCRSKTVVKKLKTSNSEQANGEKNSKSRTDKIDGVMYHLPKTVVQVSIPVKKVAKVRGDYWKFAPCFFSESELENFTSENKNSFSVGTPTFNSKGIPDTSETYVIKTKGKYFESKTLFVEYAPGSYVLQKGQAESKDETLEFTVKALATAASVASKIGPLALSADELSNASEIDNIKREKFREIKNCFGKIEKFFDDDNPATEDLRTTKEKEQAKVLAKVPVNTERRDELIKVIQEFQAVSNLARSMKGNFATYLTDNAKIESDAMSKLGLNDSEQAFLDQYSEAKTLSEEYKELNNLRKKVLQGSSTNIPPDTFKLMLEKNAEDIDSARSAFLGNSSEKDWLGMFNFIPDKNKLNSDLLFAYSKTKGICNSGQIKEKSIKVSGDFLYNDCLKTKEPEVRLLWLDTAKRNAVEQNAYLAKLEVAAQNAEAQDKSRGWFYRVPADADVFLKTSVISCKALTEVHTYDCNPLSIRFNGANIDVEQTAGIFQSFPNQNEKVALGEMQIAQFGVTASVPASSAGRSNSTEIALDPSTGAMKNFKVSSTALIDKSILDDAGKAANSAIDAVDPLNRKKRELEELKTQNQINDEKKKLTNSNTNTNN